MKIAIAGCGYVGLSLAAVLAEIGHTVTCIDNDNAKINKLKRSESPIYESGLEELLAGNVERLNFTNDKSAYADKDVIFIAVNTPASQNGSCDLTYVYAVLDDIIGVAHRTILVIKSTVPVGTCREIKRYIDKANPELRIEVVFNPEFLSQGSAISDMLNADRIVIGTESDEARAAVYSVFKKLNKPVLFTSPQSAEMIKYASNNFLALKVSYINEIANLCEFFGADIEDVARGMGMDRRISPGFLKAGIGYGGSCFPKDTKALYNLARCHDLEIKTVKAAMDANEDQNIILLKKSRKYYPDGLFGLTVAVLGLSYKPGTTDIRNAPSLSVIPALIEEGANVKCWDPIAINEFKSRCNYSVIYCDSIQAALSDADLCMIITDWSEIKAMDLCLFNTMRLPIILDGRNCFMLSALRSYTFIYDSIGRPAIIGYKLIKKRESS